MVEGKCRGLFSATAMRAYNQLHLVCPSLDFGALLEPVVPKSRVAADEAMKEHVEALVVKFRCIDPEALATTASGEGDGDTVEDTLPKATGGSEQG